MEQSPTQQTHRKRSRNQSEPDSEYSITQESPTKKAKAPAKPSKAAQRKKEAAQRRQWKSDWEDWVAKSQWKDDIENPYEQKLNTFEIHTTGAKNFYNLSIEDLGTLPYCKFENKHNPPIPGRSYSHEGVKMLVARKHATLWGVHKENVKEEVMLKEGYRLFQEKLQARRQKNPAMA